MQLVNIICGGPSSEHLCNWKGYNWVLGNRLDRYPLDKVSRIFELHDDLTQHPTGYAQWLADHKIPMVVGEDYPVSAPHIKTFDYSEAEKLYGSLYLTSSSACMVAQAIMDGFKEINVYGVDMAVDDHEYFWQRPCMEAWIGFAKGLGIKVNIPDESPLGRSSYVEGRDYGKLRPSVPIAENEATQLARMHQSVIDEASQKLSQLLPVMDEIEVLKAKIQGHDGAKQAYERIAKVIRARDNKEDIKLSEQVVINGINS